MFSCRVSTGQVLALQIMLGTEGRLPPSLSGNLCTVHTLEGCSQSLLRLTLSRRCNLHSTSVPVSSSAVAE